MRETIRAHRPELDALQARFALRIASRLSERTDALPHDIGERLRVAREQAVSHARHSRRTQAVAAPAAQVAGHSLVLGSSSPTGWQRLASVLPLIVLLLGLGMIQHLHDQAEIHAAAEIDAALLADDLPPAAYDDPGFVAYLRQPDR